MVVAAGITNAPALPFAPIILLAIDISSISATAVAIGPLPAVQVEGRTFHRANALRLGIHTRGRVSRNDDSATSGNGSKN